jgi:hypothetical protein
MGGIGDLVAGVGHGRTEPVTGLFAPSDPIIGDAMSAAAINPRA